MKRASPAVPAPLGPAGYQQLRVWQTAVDLAVECYHQKAGFPRSERFGLVAQMRRAAVSVVSNIAEGHGRSSFKAYSSHLRIARGSVKELEAQCVLAIRLGYARPENLIHALELCDHVSRMLTNLRRSIARKVRRP